MKHAKTIIALGIAVALVPFLGFPGPWKSAIFAVLGLTIATLSFRLLVDSRDSSLSKREEKSYQKDILPTEVAVAHE